MRSATYSTSTPVLLWVSDMLAGCNGTRSGVPLALALGHLCMQLLHDVGVAQGADVAELAALGDVAQEAAYDLARARFGSSSVQTMRLGRASLPMLVATCSRIEPHRLLTANPKALRVFRARVIRMANSATRATGSRCSPPATSRRFALSIRRGGSPRRRRPGRGVGSRGLGRPDRAARREEFVHDVPARADGGGVSLWICQGGVRRRGRSRARGPVLPAPVVRRS